MSCWDSWVLRSLSRNTLPTCGYKSSSVVVHPRTCFCCNWEITFCDHIIPGAFGLPPARFYILQNKIIHSHFLHIFGSFDIWKNQDPPVHTVKPCLVGLIHLISNGKAMPFTFSLRSSTVPSRTTRAPPTASNSICDVNRWHACAWFVRLEFFR